MSKKILILIISSVVFIVILFGITIFSDSNSKGTNQVKGSSNFKIVSIDELRRKLDSKDTDFILLDVRSKREYDEKHIKGAISIPVEEIEKRAGELPKDKDIIIYCHGLKCNTSRIAAGKLKNLGFSADKLQLLDGNAPEWEKKGYPTE